MPDVRYVFLLLMLAFAGCDDDEKRLRTWQQEQIAELNRQSQENSAAARALVEADAASRRQFVELHESVQAERQELADQYSALDNDRKAVAATRERVPLLATALQGLAAIALGAAALWVCGRLLGRLSPNDDSSELEETLILSLTGESNLLTEPPVLLKPPQEAGQLTAATTTDDAGTVTCDSFFPSPRSRSDS